MQTEYIPADRAALSAGLALDLSTVDEVAIPSHRLIISAQFGKVFQNVLFANVLQNVLTSGSFLRSCELSNILCKCRRKIADAGATPNFVKFAQGSQLSLNENAKKRHLATLHI